MFLGIRPEGWLTIAAILLSPLIALEVQRRVDEHRQRQKRRLEIFARLMTTRTTQMAPAHVEALNGIEVEFYAKTGPAKKVLDAWRLYVVHLDTPVGEGDAAQRWVEKKTDLLMELLYEMAQCLGYDIDRASIQKNAYYPKGFQDVELEQHALRKSALQVFSGERPLPLTMVGPVQVEKPLPPAR
jgi:Family of unknown function (DUF6680)